MAVGIETGEVELHLHSTASDGTREPAEVVREAADAGLRGVALTDHDTVDGVEEASREAERLGLRFLTGAEFSANEPGRSVHLLGFGFDVEDPELRRFFREYREDRERRAREMVERLRELGVPLTREALARRVGDGVPTRAHLARALVEEGLVPDEETVFRRYLSRGKPAFVEKRPTPPAEVFDLVHGAGGVALVAHPGWTHGVDRIRGWVEEGMDGVEVLHPSHAPEVRRRLDRLADELGLLRSGGSDWHGHDDGRHAPLGSQRVPMRWMEELEARCERSGARSQKEEAEVT